MAIRRDDAVAVLTALTKDTASADMLIPKVFTDATTEDAHKLRVRMGAILSDMVTYAWIRPVTVQGRTVYEVTATGRQMLWQWTAN